MADAYICDFVRTPIGRYGGVLKDVRTDDLAAHPMRVLKERNPSVDWDQLDDVIYGCANQAGEDNRNVARMAALLAGLPDACFRLHHQPAVRLRPRRRRHCGARHPCGRRRTDDRRRRGEHDPRAVRHGQGDRGVLARTAEVYDTTIGWRFVNPLMKAQYGVDAMPETAENVAEDFQVTRADQDAFAYRSQMRAKAAQENGFFAREIAPVEIAGRKGTITVDTRRASARRHHAGWPGQAEDAVPQAGRHGDGGQRVGRERRRRGADHRLRGRRRRGMA